jgi:uncharacterized membrane protein YbhN (UPF0104 family)
VSRPRWIAAITMALGVLVIALAVRALVANWNTASAQPLDWQLHPAWLALALLLVLFGFVVLIEGWRRILAGMGNELRFFTAARIWTVSSLGKYVPGKVWATAGAVIMSQRAGASGTNALTAAIAMQGLAVASGIVVCGVLGIGADRLGSSGEPLLLLLAACASVGVLALVSPALVAHLNTLLPAKLPPLRPLTLGALAAGFGTNVVAWVAYGLALIALARGSLPGMTLPFGEATGIFAAAYLAGLVAVITPGGLGVREGALVLLLTPLTGSRVALALAIASRVLFTVAELLAAAPFLLWRDRAASPSAPRSAP